MGGNPNPPEVHDEPEEIDKPKAKRKKQKATDQEVAAQETPTDRGTAKRKETKIKKEGRAVVEHVESEQASHKAKKRKKESKDSGEADVHPSWNAAKKKEKSGALVKGAGARTTFNSDAED